MIIGHGDYDAWTFPQRRDDWPREKLLVADEYGCPLVPNGNDTRGE
jgi:hypothetical protein